MEQARNTIQTSIIRGLERLGGFGGVADLLNRYNHFLGDPDYLAKDLARYDNASATSVKRLTSEKLARNKRVVVYGVPGEKVILEVPKRTAEQVAPAGEPRSSTQSPKEST